MAKPSAKYANSPELILIGKNIQKIRRGRGLSQEALSIEAGLDRSYMGGVERGEHNLTVMNLHKIAYALGVEVTALFKRA